MSKVWASLSPRHPHIYEFHLKFGKKDLYWNTSEFLKLFCRTGQHSRELHCWESRDNSFRDNTLTILLRGDVADERAENEGDGSRHWKRDFSVLEGANVNCQISRRTFCHIRLGQINVLSLSVSSDIPFGMNHVYATYTDNKRHRFTLIYFENIASLKFRPIARKEKIVTNERHWNAARRCHFSRRCIVQNENTPCRSICEFASYRWFSEQRKILLIGCFIQQDWNKQGKLSSSLLYI